jgi:hypothetical protein
MSQLPNMLAYVFFSNIPVFIFFPQKMREELKQGLYLKIPLKDTIYTIYTMYFCIHSTKQFPNGMVKGRESN